MLLTDVKGNLQMLKGGSRFESLRFGGLNRVYP
jgi:hypothetical protein